MLPRRKPMEEGSRDQPARRWTASMDDSRCERGPPHTMSGIGSHPAARIALLPTWVVAGCQSQLKAHLPSSSGRASHHGGVPMGRVHACAA